MLSMAISFDFNENNALYYWNPVYNAFVVA